MDAKFRALGFAGAVVLTISAAFVAASAFADTGGHFTSDLELTTLVGKESGEFHKTHFRREGSSNEETVGCKTDSYHGIRAGKTFTDVRINPEWEECYTTGNPNEPVWDIVENDCFFVFRIGDTGTHHTVELFCPDGKKIEVKHPNCTVEVPPQLMNGIVYKTDMINNKHAITLEATVQDIKSQYHAGICIFLGTNHEYEFEGSLTVEGLDPETLAPTNITATTTA